jgi:hypothetical protein
MNFSPSPDSLSGSLPVWPQNLGSEQPHQSLFSLLLEIETRLRAEARRDSILQATQRSRSNAKKLSAQVLRTSLGTLNSSMLRLE